MKRIILLIRKIIRAEGWMPVLVVLLSRAFYFFFNFSDYPNADIIMHLAGGFAIAFFVSGCYRGLTREGRDPGYSILMELVLVGSLTITAAVFWEFKEFISDYWLGSNLQISLANTMQDLAVGIIGCGLFILFRAWQLRVGFRELTFDWINGETG